MTDPFATMCIFGYFISGQASYCLGQTSPASCLSPSTSQLLSTPPCAGRPPPFTKPSTHLYCSLLGCTYHTAVFMHVQRPASTPASCYPNQRNARRSRRAAPAVAAKMGWDEANAIRLAVRV